MTTPPDSIPLAHNTPDPDTPRQPMVARVAPAITLFILSPIVAEYLLGNISFSSIAWGLLFLAPMYGGGALLVREVTRRSGRGWGTMILLATAYGLLEAGLLDQSLFNPSFMGWDFQSIAPIPGIGVSAYWAQVFLVGHAIWSISVPIALVEALVPRRSTTPWLGNLGLFVTTVIFILGSWIIFVDHQATGQFMASPPQLLGTSIGILALIVAAFTIRTPSRATINKAAPNPWGVGILAFLASSLFFLRPESWLGVAIGFGLMIGTAIFVTQWSKRKTWGVSHRLALAGGALLTYAWVGFVAVPMVGDQGMMKWVGNIILTLFAIGLLIVAVRTVQKGQLSQEVSQ
jgi:hypothetical protein